MKRLIASMTSARAAGVFAGGATALVVLATALSAWSWPGPSRQEGVERIAAITRGDLSDRSLAAVAARMDPATLALARRHDPAAAPAKWGEVDGWGNLSLSGRPDLGFDPQSADEARRLNAATPGLRAAIAMARPLFIPIGSAERSRAARCLSLAIYYEAALEPREGQEGVAQVILNRVRDPNFPNTVCGVVFQGADLNTGCQFSFTCDGSMARAPVPAIYRRVEEVADHALNGYVAPQVGTATFYHADYVLPYWSPTLLKLDQIGRHIFYRWRGSAGEPGSLVQPWRGHEPAIDEAKYRRPRAVPAPAMQQVQQSAITVTTPDGGTRVVTSIGGRRIPTKTDIETINARLGAYEQTLPGGPSPAAPKAAPKGVTQMEVVEVGKSSAKSAPATAPSNQP